MPFPQFPELPDDKPLLALAIFLTYLRRVWEFIQTSNKYLVLIAIAFFSAVGICLRLWTDTALPLLADAVPMLVAIAGVVMSYKQPKRESHLMTTVVLFAVGVVGTAVMSWTRIRTEHSHQAEVRSLTDRMDLVRDQNTSILLTLHVPPTVGASPQEAELERRQNIEKVLRGEYILSHENISPEILAGTEYPPADWMNSRLRELGEKWTISDASHKGTHAPEPLDVRGEKLCLDILDFAKEAEQEEPSVMYGPSISKEVTLQQALQLTRTNERLQVEFEKRFGGSLPVIMKELEARGIVPDVHPGDPPPNPFEMQLAGTTLCKMVYSYRQKEHISEPRAQEKLTQYQPTRPCLGNPASQDDPFLTEHGDQVGTRAIVAANILSQKAEACIRRMSNGGKESDERASYIDDIRKCCRDEVIKVHYSILSRCPNATDPRGEEAFNTFLRESDPSYLYPSCNAEEVAKYLRDIGSHIKEAVEMRRP